MWSHRSYKAKLPLRIFLAAANSMAFQVGMEGPAEGNSLHKGPVAKGQTWDLKDYLYIPCFLFYR